MTKTILIRIISLMVVVAVIVAVFLYITRTPKPEVTGVETVEGYSTVTSVAGCTFMVNGTFTEKATAVTQISDGVDFATSDFYSYKNGTDQYMLFCLDDNSGIVVAVEKGTAFDLATAADPDSAVKDTDLMGIWFGTDKEGIKLEKEGNKCEGNVTAQVVITNNIFNDFVGKIVTLRDNGEEWALFVGIPGDRYKNLTKAAKAGIETIADSFRLSDNTGEFQEEEYAVVIDGSRPTEDNTVQISENVVSGDKITTTVSEDVVTISENTVSEDVVIVSDNDIPDTIISENEGVSENDIKEDEESEDEKETVSEDEPEDEVVVKEPESIYDQGYRVELPKEEPDTEPTDTVRTRSTVIKDWDDNKAYSSSVYSMLNIGQTGLFDTISKVKNGAEQLMARIDGINDSKMTYALIENAESAGKSPLKYFEAPPGCHWESAVYSINYAGVNDRPYVNVKLVGADGKALKFRGIKYPSMTYDLYTGAEKDGWKQGNIVYYAVPNGCTEYVLRIGDGDDINSWRSAYYYVNRAQ